MITPSFPTFSIASAINSPTSAEPEEIAATCAMASFDSTGREMRCNSSTAAFVASSIPRRMPTGFAPAVTFFNPSRTMACVKTVAVVVPSPAISFVLDATSATSFAPIFSK